MLKTFLFFIFSLPIIGFAQWVDSTHENYQAYYYQDGTLSSEGLMQNGKPNGYWITYYPNSLRKSEGNRKDFLLDSTWRFYRENGNLKNIINYKEDKKHGKSYYYNDECQLIAEEIYENGKLEGDKKIYFPSEDSLLLLKELIPYEADLKNGYSFQYAKDGRIISIVQYKNGFVKKREKINRKDKEGRKQGLWKTYYSNYRLKKEERYQNNLLNGYVKRYNKEGKLESASLYIKGVKQSEEENIADFNIEATYYADGSKKSEITYNLAGKKDGIAKYYTENGEVEKTEIYRNDYLLAKGIIDKEGLYQGVWENYYLSGKLKSKGSYLDGKKYNKWEYFYQNGQLEQLGFYDKNGKYTGEWKWYYDNGQLLREEEFRRGLEDGYLKEFDREGNLITEGEFIDGEREGEWFYELNDHKEEGKYRYGERNGIWKHYYPNGKLSFEGNYAEGREEGKHLYYYPSGSLKKREEYSYGEKVGKWKWFNEDGFETMEIIYKNDQPKRINGTKVKFSESD